MSEFGLSKFGSIFLDRIAELTLESGGYCQALIDYFVDRLEKRSCHVKLKVLKIMKFIVENGHPDFRQGLRRQSRGIKAATSECWGVHIAIATQRLVTAKMFVICIVRNHEKGKKFGFAQVNCDTSILFRSRSTATSEECLHPPLLDIPSLQIYQPFIGIERNLYHPSLHYTQSTLVPLTSECSGKPDPLHGNTPYILVREAAQDLSQLLFNVSSEDSELPRPEAVTMKSTGEF